MTDPPHLLKPTRHPSGQSPTRNRLSDDILAHLGPASAVDALTTATGALRTCLSGASMTERDFAMQTAVASKTIWEWVHELQDWPWPSEGGSAGFEMPSRKHKRLSIQVTVPEGEDDEYMGSLLSQEVVSHERRIAQIRRDLEDLNIEEIKTHVLNNHIMPLSRPGTPLLNSGRSGLAATYNKMEDISAVITTIAVQALPNLSNLSRLLQTWKVRLVVLRRVPPLLLAIQDAEVAVKSGWNAISLPSNKLEHAEQPTLSRGDFDVMKLVLEKKISKPGRSLDYMLDSLEGFRDTLPEEWLDRMEAVEQGYADWVAACERKIRETEWSKVARPRARSPSPRKTATDTKDSRPSAESFDAADPVKRDVAAPLPLTLNGIQDTPSRSRELRLVSQTSEASEAETVVPDSPTKKMFLNQRLDSTEDQADGAFDGTRVDQDTSAPTKPITPTIREFPPIEETSPTPATPYQNFSRESYTPEGTPGSNAEEGSPELPPLPLRHMTSQSSVISQASTIVHGDSSYFVGVDSDLPEVSASPDLPRTRIREAEYLQASPPSSPPIPDADSRESSMTPFDSPLLPPTTNDDSFIIPTTSLDDSFTEDFDDSFSVSEFTGPLDRRESTGDQHLRHQIGQILESIPARIKLSTEPPAINLNPPDLQLPKIRKKPSIDPFKRSTSGLSNFSSSTSRAGTPSFTLSPAKNARSRTRGQQEIKVYHLSRSTGEAPIKLFIRCVGEQGERVMVRVGGGWADLGEYLKEYASHHKRRSAGIQTGKVEVGGHPHVPVTRGTSFGSSPPQGRPASALERSPMTPLAVRKTRRSVGAMGSEVPRLLPRTPALLPPKAPAFTAPKTPALTAPQGDDGPDSEESNRSRSSSRLSWAEDDSSFLGLAGPSGKRVEMSEENKAWVESVKEKVRLASGERKVSAPEDPRRFGELGKVGGTKRLFRKTEGLRKSEGPRELRKRDI
ncbi:Fc.00g051850.m01.CDS01 [Cosmosporella sp. VM-42]